MDGRQGAPYPYYNMDKINKMINQNNFDKYKKKTAKREKFKVSIGRLHATKRGKQSVHAHYKYDSSKLTGLQLLSLPDNVDIN